MGEMERARQDGLLSAAVHVLDDAQQIPATDRNQVQILAVKQLVECLLYRKPVAREILDLLAPAPAAPPKTCGCGDGTSEGVHRFDGPCYVAPAAPPAVEPGEEFGPAPEGYVHTHELRIPQRGEWFLFAGKAYSWDTCPAQGRRWILAPAAPTSAPSPSSWVEAQRMYHARTVFPAAPTSGEGGGE